MKVYEILVEINRRDFLKGAVGAAVGAAASMLPGKAHAAGRWFKVGIDHSGLVGAHHTIYIDTNSIVRHSNQVGVWVKIVAPKNQEKWIETTYKNEFIKRGNENLYPYQRLPNGELAIIQRYIFDMYNHTYDLDPPPKYPGEQPVGIVPDSMPDFMLDAIKQHLGL